MPNTDNNVPVKKMKDFNEEEKAAILARANKIDIARVAKEFGTSWQVVSAIQKAAKNTDRKTKIDSATRKKSLASDAKASSAAKRIARIDDDKRLEILKRASEVGVTEAATEAGVSKWTVFQWRKLMRKAGHDVPPALNIRNKTKVEVDTPQKTKTSISVPANKSGLYSQLELENEMLKQQVANLSEQIKKLRAALSQLA